MIRFCYEEDSGSDVWLLPDEQAMSSCDFSKATQICTESQGADDDCCNYYVELDDELKIYYFASQNGCEAGQKAAVQIDNYDEVGDACYDKGLVTSRISRCACNFEDSEFSTLAEPCHSQFVAGCNYHAPDLGEDTSCCETATCVGKHKNYTDPIGKEIEDDRKKTCEDNIPGRCANIATGDDNCCTSICTACGTDASPYNEWSSCTAGNATTGIGLCGSSSGKSPSAQFKCNFNECEEGDLWYMDGDLYRDWIVTVDPEGYEKRYG